MLELVLDIAVISLLLMTIIFCWRLNSKIVELKSGRKDLLDLIRTLDSAILKTNTNINDLKVMSQNSAVELSSLVTKAQDQINDLSFINETAARLADRLEKNMVEARYLHEKLRENFVPHQPKSMQVDYSAAAKDARVREKEVATSRTFKSGFSKAKEELLSALRFVK